MAQNAHIINNPDVCYELLAGYITPVDISERDKYPTIKVETIMTKEGIR